MIKTLFFTILFLVSGCAKSVLLKYATPETKLLCEENFYYKYHALILDEEKKEFQNIKTLVECEEFLDKFWKIRDTDPTTKKNEFKDEKEKLAHDIENEILFQNSNTPGFSFKNNRNFFGGAAQIYMLHGMPDYTETIQGNTFVDLMVWVYGDEHGNIKYRFLFYQRGGISHYEIFWPQRDGFIALTEIAKSQPADPYIIYDELSQKGAYLFLAALISFSDNSETRLENALKPPRPASEIAKEYAPETKGKIEENINLLLNNSNTTIKAQFSAEIQSQNIVIKISINHKDLDWILKNGELWSKVLSRIIITNTETRETIVDERFLETISSKEKIEAGRHFSIFEIIPEKKLQSNKFNINVYLKMIEPNTGKYNAWVEKIQK